MAKAKKVAKKIKTLVKKVMIGRTLYTPVEGKLPPEKEHADLIARGFIVETVEGSKEAIVDPKSVNSGNTTIVAELNKDEKVELGSVVRSNQELANKLIEIPNVKTPEVIKVPEVTNAPEIVEIAKVTKSGKSKSSKSDKK